MANLVLEKNGTKHSLPLKPISNDRISNYYLQFEKNGRTYIRELFEEAPANQRLLQFEKNSKKIFLTKTTPSESMKTWQINQNIHISNGLRATFSSGKGSDGRGEIFNLFDYYNWNETDSYGSIIGTKTDSFYYIDYQKPIDGTPGTDATYRFTVSLIDKGAIKVFNCILNLPGGLPGKGYYMDTRNDESLHFPPSNYQTPYNNRQWYSPNGGYYNFSNIPRSISFGDFKNPNHYDYCGIESFYVRSHFDNGVVFSHYRSDPDDYSYEKQYLKRIYEANTLYAAHDASLRNMYVQVDSRRNNYYGGERLPGYGFNVELYIKQSCDIKITDYSYTREYGRRDAPEIYMNNDLKELVSKYGKINIYNDYYDSYVGIPRIYDRNVW